jgi:hypothetical protein
MIMKMNDFLATMLKGIAFIERRKGNSERTVDM